MTVETVCEPALPPVPMSSGMKNESATTLASSSSKCAEHGAGRGLGDEEQHEPGDAAPHDLEQRGLEVGQPRGDLAGDAALIEQAGADLGQRGVEQVVDAHRADEAARLVDRPAARGSRGSG